jgi:hypothetical protein
MNYIKSIPKMLLAALPPTLLAFLLFTPVALAGVPVLKANNKAPGTPQAQKAAGSALFWVELAVLGALMGALALVAWRATFGDKEKGIGKPLGGALISLIVLAVLNNISGFANGWNHYFGF